MLDSASYSAATGLPKLVAAPEIRVWSVTATVPVTPSPAVEAAALNLDVKLVTT